MIVQTSTLWNIQLFGGLKVFAAEGSATITRFRSQRYAALLAFLALYPNRQHTREELADMLWPDSDPEAARTNLRTALASLRRQLEGHAVSQGDVIQAVGRTHIRIVPEAVATDVKEFEKALFRARQSGNSPDALESALHDAIRQYHGPLLPGSYEPWALTERDRFAEAYQNALLQLCHCQERRGDSRGAYETALLAVAADPLREEARALLIIQHRRLGEDSAARRQFHEIERLLKENFQALPSQMLVRALRDPLPAAPPALTVEGRRDSRPAARDRREQPDAREANARTTDVPGIPQTTKVLQPPAVHLPLILSRFFGREPEMAHLSRLLHDVATRLVTLTGTGGSGKTRLAVETVKRLAADAFPAGIWFISLADLRSATRIPEAIARSLGLPAGSPQSSQEEQLISALLGLGDRALLVLDNLEQLVEIGAPLQIRTLLERVPTLAILATSRQPLGIEGEQEVKVNPLPVPTLAGSSDRLMDFPSIQLFVNRAQATRPDFPFNTRNSEAVAALCARLEGIPLAIELAAAWSQTLTPVQMLQRIEGNGQSFSFDLLASRRRDASPRHATLRSAIAWSYDLLAPAVRHFFAVLSVFRGGWTLEAAEFVSDEPSAPLLVAELQERSLLLSQEQEDGQMRYRFLEPLRDFADDQLTGDARTVALKRHADYFLGLGEQAEPSLSSSEQIATVRRLTPEMENFRAVLLRATDTAPTVDSTTALRLAGAIGRFWEARGGIREGADFFIRLLTVTEAPQNAPGHSYRASRAKVLRCTGGLLCALGEYEKAQQYLKQALDIYEDMGEETEAARTLMNLGNASYYRGNLPYARDSYERGLVTARRQNDASLTARILSNMAMVVQNQGDLETALRLYREGLDLCRKIKDEPGTANALLNLGALHLYREELPEAIGLFEECRSLSQAIGHRALYVRSLHNLGVAARDQGDLKASQSLLEETRHLLQEAEDKYGLGAVWEDLGLLAVEQGSLAEAATLYRQSLKIRQDNGERIGVAFTLQNMGLLAARQKNAERSVQLLGAASVLCEALGSPLSPQQQRRQSAILPDISAALGEAAFTKLWEAGRALSLDEAVNLALNGVDRPARSARTG